MNIKNTTVTKDKTLEIARWVHQESQKRDALAKDGQIISVEGLFSHVSTHQSKASIDLFLKHYSIDQRNSDGYTLLAYTSMHANSLKKDFIETLLAHGLDINAVNKEGNTALCLCSAFDNDKNPNTFLLIEAGANPNLGANEYPLLWAVMNNNYELAQALLENGASLDVTWGHESNFPQATVIDTAKELAEFGDSSMLELLTSHQEKRRLETSLAQAPQRRKMKM